MSEISFFKSKRDINLPDSNNNIQPKVTDSLYIIKDRGTKGRIYYDYDENTRIEIGSLNDVLYCKEYEINENGIIIAKLNNFYKYNESGKTIILQNPDSEIEVNKLVTSNDGLYIIKQINVNDENNIVDCNLARLYKQQDITWNEYF